MTCEQWIERSFDCLDHDSVPEAAEALRMALRADPGGELSGHLLSNLATLERQLGHLQAADSAYTLALAYLPGHLAVLRSRARLRAEMDSLGSAIDDWCQVIAQQPDDVDALYERGLCRLMHGDTLGARGDFEAIDRLNPTSARSRMGMAAVYKAERLWAEAADLYDALLTANPRNASLLLGRAEVYFMSGRMGAALSDVNRSIELDPRDPMAYYLRARIRAARRDPEYARRDLSQALALGLDPSLAERVAATLR